VKQWRVLDLFSGIGGFSLGLERAGMKTVAFCEIDPFCRRVLAKHWPDVPCHDDITTREFIEGEADIITGGFPCQDVSCAGKRAGLAGASSGLYRELVRAIRLVRPRYAIVENVAALLGDGMGTVLGDLAESRADAEWDCVPAFAIGAPHERDRVWIVAHASREQVGPARQSRQHVGMGSGSPDAARIGCRQGWAWRPPDSFARVRDEARRNAADPCGARLAFRAGLGRDAWEELSPAERNRLGYGGQSLWPDEPALSRVDDGIPDWLDRVKSTGNTILPQIPELIGKAIIEQDGMTA
jgi:DNA (cytosine-5)-methyltransferase 1